MVSFQENVDLHPFTTFRVGGKARYFVQVKSESDFPEIFRWAEEKSVSVFVLGGGSNVIFSDRGFDGLVLKMENAEVCDRGEGRIFVESGATLYGVIEFARGLGYAGMERLAGIPGTIGGAIRGNAGAFGAETAQSVSSVRAFDRNTREVREYSKEMCEFGYRESFFKTHPENILLSAELLLLSGSNREVLEALIRETIDTREKKHPQRILCAGSFFMNPVVFDEGLRKEFERDTGMLVKDNKLPAGWLIDYVGLRGKEVGGAKVSNIHPNYLINTGGATAESILILASIVKQRVRTELGVRLREEVQMVGF